MIDLYTWYSPNGQRVRIMLEECELPYRDFLVDEYTIADIACFPWLARHGRLGVKLDGLPNLQRWLTEVGARPAVRRGLEPIG